MSSPNRWPGAFARPGLGFALALACFQVSSLPAAAGPTAASLPTVQSRTGARFDFAGRCVAGPAAAAARASGRAMTLRGTTPWESDATPSFIAPGAPPSRR